MHNFQVNIFLRFNILSTDGDMETADKLKEKHGET